MRVPACLFVVAPAPARSLRPLPRPVSRPVQIRPRPARAVSPRPSIRAVIRYLRPPENAGIGKYAPLCVRLSSLVRLSPSLPVRPVSPAPYPYPYSGISPSFRFTVFYRIEACTLHVRRFRCFPSLYTNPNRRVYIQPGILVICRSVKAARPGLMLTGAVGPLKWAGGYTPRRKRPRNPGKAV